MSLVSAPGFLANEKALSPVIERLTKAKVVNTEGSVINPLVSIGTLSSTLLKKSPCMSAPILPIKADFNPTLDTAVSIFAGAPPGFCSKSLMPAGESPAGVKSINNSPNATTSNFFIENSILCKVKYEHILSRFYRLINPKVFNMALTNITIKNIGANTLITIL